MDRGSKGVVMHVVLRSNIQISNTLREHVEAKVELALRRFRDRVGVVTVRLTDVNGPRGGVDKRCRMLLTMSGHAPLVVEAWDQDPYAAVTQATARLDEQVARAVTRKRRRPGHDKQIVQMLRDAS